MDPFMELWEISVTLKESVTGILVCDSSLISCIYRMTDWEGTPAVAESPEIKLFGKWSTDDVQINDISLQVTPCLV